MRLGLIHVAQETCTFNPLPTTLDDYRAFGIHEGLDIPAKVGDLGQVGGHYAAVTASGLAIETVPIIRAWAIAGGRITREAHAYFMEKIERGLKAAGPLDGLVLQLHGACSAVGLDDVEGAQTELCRSILGPGVPILLGLDHHANVTARMVDNASAIVTHRTQPHDTFDTGVIGTQLLLKLLATGARPATAWRKIPLISHQEQFLTSGGPMKIWFDRARALERDPRVLQVSPFPMQPWLDIEEAGWAVVIHTDGDQALAEALADDMADLAWAMRDDFQVREALAIDAAVLEAERTEAGVVCLSDTGDTVFGGAAGDSTLILEAMLRLGTRKRALLPMIGPRAVARLAEAGVGASVTLPIGAEVATDFFRPVTVTGRVKSIADGQIRVTDGHQREIDMGLTAILEVGPITILASERRGVAGNLPDVYRAFGVEPRDHHVAVLKTASNFQYFAPITSRVIRVDTTGPGQSNVHTLPWRRLPRPIHPLDALDDRRVARSSPSPAQAAE